MTHAKQSPLSYADSAHSHLFTAIIITCSGDCVMIYVQNTSEIKPRELFTVKNGACSYKKFKIRAFADISTTFLSLSCSFWATLQAAAPENGVTFGLNLPCCISMTGYIVRENPLLREMQTHAAGMQIHNATDTHTHVRIIILNNADKTLHRQTEKNTHTHTVVTPKSSTIRPARYNGVVWMGSNNGALWHLNRARWWVSQEAE